MNLLALERELGAAAGLFDTAVTNGLLVIVANEWPGEEVDAKRRTLPATKLLVVISGHGGLREVREKELRLGLDTTQATRHGRADDEFETLSADQIAAAGDLDEHVALRFVEIARGLTPDEAVVRAYRDRVEEELPFGPKDRLDVPEPDLCDECGRETFLRDGWDMFGGNESAGWCVACGHVVTDDEAYERAIDAELERRMHDGS